MNTKATPKAPLASLANLRLRPGFTAALDETFYRRVQPSGVQHPRLCAFSAACALDLGLDPTIADDPEFAAVFSGNRLLPGADPAAMDYAGHQFGTWVPQLGDGRAHILGDLDTQAGAVELQLKGSGPTPFCRGADGRAVLRSSLREFLASEAMAALGIATTRALCVTASDQPVMRETIESAAVLTRAAPSHVRFGSFERFHHRGQHAAVKQLADYVIARFHPELAGHETPYGEWFDTVVRRTAVLMADWQAYGFVHGVMNTDNMSILGLTLDYGPYAFMEAFIPDYAPNHTDVNGRYAYAAQAGIGHWNLRALAAALPPLVDRERLEAGLELYGPAFLARYGAHMRARLGLAQARDTDGELVDELLTLLARQGADYPRVLRALGELKIDEGACDASAVLAELPDRDAAQPWLARYAARLREEGSRDAPRRARMHAVNPLYVLRTHLAQHAIERAQQGDDSETAHLLTLLQQPFEAQAGCEAYARPAPDAAPPVLSCSS